MSTACAMRVNYDGAGVLDGMAGAAGEFACGPGAPVCVTVDMDNGIYAPGILKNVQQTRGAAMSFSFFGEDLWRLEVRDKPALTFCRPCSPVKYKHGALGRHWLSVVRVDDES